MNQFSFIKQLLIGKPREKLLSFLMVFLLASGGEKQRVFPARVTGVFYIWESVASYLAIRCLA